MTDTWTKPGGGCQGGRVPGRTRIDVTQGKALEVQTASFDPGYPLEESYEGGDERNKFTEADLIQGYRSHGRYVGEKR
jgi:hypothetical protein